FADQFPNNGLVGPVGITFGSAGAVMISSYAAGKVAVFANDIDGQHYSAAALSTTTYTASNAAGLATTGGNYYMDLQQTGSVIQVDALGNLVQTIVTGMGSATAIVANPTNGHLFVSTLGSNAIYDVDP